MERPPTHGPVAGGPGSAPCLPQGAAVLWVGAAVLGVASLDPSTYLGVGIVALLTALQLGGSGRIAWGVWQKPLDGKPGPA